MGYVAKRYQSELDKIKKDVEQAYIYSKPNYERYHYFRKFLYKSTLTDDQIALLKELGRPTLEFNICEAYVSRLSGEFATQEPSLAVRGANLFSANDPQVAKLVEGITRNIFNEAKNDYLMYETYKRLLSGGFDVWKLYTDYAHEMSFDQLIKIRAAFDPTMCGFDPTARESHKGDGQFCFELYPQTEDEFIAKYGSDAAKDLKFERNLMDFNWSFDGDNGKTLIVGDYYKKKLKKAKIVQLVTGQVVTVEEYDRLIGEFNQRGYMVQPPGTVGTSRETEITTICHYHIIQNKVLHYEETDYKILPLIYMAGNSAVIRDSVSGGAQEVTRPYIYNAEGMQKLINFAGQSLANELENTLQQKWVVAKEAIAEGYQEAFVNPQVASTVVYNAFKVDDPTVALPPPREVNRAPSPPEAANTFMSGSQVVQTILGSYDATLGIQQKSLSGVAIENGATQSNATAMPFIIGFMKGYNQAAIGIVDLIPKYYKTPRTVPVVGLDGKRTDALINHPQGTDINYSSNDLQVEVKAGVSFAIQQQRALEAMLGLAKESPMFAGFLNEYGLETLLDNIDIRGIDHLKQASAAYMKEVQEKKASTPNPEMMKMQLMMAEFQETQKKNTTEAQLEAARISVSAQDSDTNRILALSKIGQSADELELKRANVQAENTRSAVEFAIKTADMHQGHAHKAVELHHKMNESKRAAKEKSTQNESS